MRGMNSRQATKQRMACLALLAFITACSPSNPPTLTPTPPPPTSTPVPSLTPLPPTLTATPTSTPLTCLTQPGRTDEGVVTTTNPPQEYRIYLPPCYDQQTSQRYPVLYLLHGQTYTSDQWIRLGATDAANDLILSGAAPPFIIVFPDDRYWNLEAGPGFGDRLVNALIPHIDSTYRTIAYRDQRAIGGLSRGSGWAIRLGLSRWDLFSIIGLHSLAVFKSDGTRIERWLKAIPPDDFPTIYMDIGDRDPELAEAMRVEALFNQYRVPHAWYQLKGDHTEKYWSAHTREYIQWYASQWKTP